MPAPVLSAAWADALQPGIRAWFYLGMQRRPTIREQIFTTYNGVKDTDFFENFGAIAPDAWLNFENGDTVSSVGYDAGYKLSITPKEYIVKLPIRRKFLEDNLYPQIMNPTMMLGDSFSLRQETDAASVFNNSTSASFVGPDAVALGSASHPQSPTKSGSTQSNLGTTALTTTSVETARLAMQAFTDDAGSLVGVYPDTLIVPPALEYTANQLFKSPEDPTTANRAINPRAGAYNIIRWDYLTDSNDWFLVDSMRMKQNLLWDDRIPISINLMQGDTSIEATWIARARYAFGWTDWRWIYVNHVA